MKAYVAGLLRIVPAALALAAGRPLSARAAQADPGVPPELGFERITTADGLSFPVVRDIAQDRQGFIWIATDSGLNRFDGYEFAVYREDPGDAASIRFDDVYAVYEDSDGDLWVGGGGGLDRFDRSSGTFVHVDTRGQVYVIHEDASGTIWAGFWHGLYGYDRATGEIVHSTQPKPDVSDDWSARTESAVQAIYEDQEGTLWIGTVAGLYGLDRETGAFAPYHHEPQDPTSLSDDRVSAILEDRHGALWVGTGKGLNQLDRSSGVVVRYWHDPDDPGSLSDDTVLSILEDSGGTLWVGTMRGLDRFDREQNRFHRHRNDAEDPESLGDDVVVSLFEDRSGVLWVGTSNGVSRSNRREGQFALYRKHQDPPVARSYSLDVPGLLSDPQPPILSDSKILAVEEDARGVLWIGTFTGGLNRLDRQAGRVSVYRNDPQDASSLSTDSVGAVFADRAGMLWVGTSNGWLEQFDPATESFIHHEQLGAGVSAIAEDPAGNLWIGTSGDGLYRLAPDRTSVEHFPQFWRDPDHWWRYGTLSSHAISSLFVDPSGVLWAGTIYGGINLWGVERDRFTHLRHDPASADSLSHDQVLAIYQDPGEEGPVWIGTGAGGLNRYDRATGSVRHYREADGLQADMVGCIAADDGGYLWLSTVKGLSRFDPRTESFRSYDRRDGVGVLSLGMVEPGTCLRSQTGEMVFGGSDGLYIFDPRRVREDLHPPPVAVTSLSVSNEPRYTDLSSEHHIRLPHQDNFLSFEYAALDYTMPEKNEYAYRLEGLDRDWVHAGTRRYADYPDLRPGNYVFRVRAANSDGVWNKDGAAIQITIEPPLWQTWPFRGLAALAVVLFGVGVYRQRVMNIETRSRELERQVEERTEEIRSLSEKARQLAVVEERQRLARDLHDAVSQTLFSASLIAETLPQVWHSSEVEGEQLLDKLQQLSRGALAEMRGLLMELRPAALVETSMRDLLRQLGQAVSGREGVPVAVTVGPDCTAQDFELPADVHVALYRIAQEALNNVAKHAQASRVDVDLECLPGPGTPQMWRVRLDIRDDGLGFDPEAVSREHLGIGIMRERAASIGAGLEIESEAAQGTRVTVTWPALDREEGADEDTGYE
ncbi:MAG: two-component regulator propeller domain-containing protein [Anaerolineae bacterium]